MKYDVGVQSFTYRNFSVDAICSELEGTGVSAVEFCGVHITPDAQDAAIDELKNKCADAGLTICGFGVHGFSGAGEVADTLQFAKKLGVDYVSLDFDHGDRELGEELIARARDLDLLLAIHNHGPQARYSTVEDVEAACRQYPQPLGACVDTGHFFRSGQSPSDVIPRLGDRVHAIHVKDFIDVSTEVVPGEGQLDLGEMVALLEEHTSFDQPLVIEYEEDADNPTPAVLKVVEALEGLQ